MASAAQGNHPPRCAQAPAEAYARPAGSRNRLPVLDSEAPKLPIHTAIAVPQYGTQGSVGHPALPIWRLSPLRTWIPATLGSATASDPPPRNTALRTVRELRCCAGQPARRCLPVRGPSKTARRSGNRPALCRRLGVRPGQHRRERLGDLLAGVLGCRQSVPPTRSPGPSRSWSPPYESSLQWFRAPGQALRTAADLLVRCHLLSPRFRRVAAPARPTQAVSAQPLDYAAFPIHSRTGVRYPGPE
jgi:hypothetical protein